MPHEDYCYALERENKTLNKKYDDCVRQLTEAHARIDRFESAPKGWWHKEIESLRQQLADSQKREVMLRNALDYANSILVESYDHVIHSVVKALAATADMKDVILCEKKPVARKISYGSLVFLEGYAELSEGTSLYRAWEQEK